MQCNLFRANRLKEQLDGEQTCFEKALPDPESCLFYETVKELLHNRKCDSLSEIASGLFKVT